MFRIFKCGDNDNRREQLVALDHILQIRQSASGRRLQSWQWKWLKSDPLCFILNSAESLTCTVSSTDQILTWRPVMTSQWLLFHIFYRTLLFKLHLKSRVLLQDRRLENDPCTYVLNFKAHHSIMPEKWSEVSVSASVQCFHHSRLELLHCSDAGMNDNCSLAH